MKIVETLRKGGKPKVGRRWADAAAPLASKAAARSTGPAVPSAAPLTLTCLSNSPPSDRAQPGSQHRSKAEPAGAVVAGKWVPSPPKAGEMTLMGAWGGWHRGGCVGEGRASWTLLLRVLLLPHSLPSLLFFPSPCLCRRAPGPLLPQPG